MDYSQVNNVWAFMAFVFSSVFGLFQFLTMKETKKLTDSANKHQRSLEDILNKLKEEVTVVSHTTNAAYYLALHANKRIDKKFKETVTSELLNNIDSLRNDHQISLQSNHISQNLSTSKSQKQSCITK